MKILVINSGSSSIKYQLFEMMGQMALAGGSIERIGQQDSQTTHWVYRDGKVRKHNRVLVVKDHRAGLKIVAQLLTDPEIGIIPHPSEVDAVGHRVVHGGENFSTTALIGKDVRASIKKVFNKIKSPYIGYEMHVEYIQVHGGVEGDSASVAMDIALISDYIKQPVNQKYGVTGSLTGDIILAVGGVTEKVRSIMDPDLGMEGACIPWQNKHDIEPLLINIDSEYIQNGEIPGIRIYRDSEKQNPFDIFFCKTKYNAYKIIMGLDQEEVEKKMVERSKKDFELIMNIKNTRKEKQTDSE